ncbi:MAG: excinuclease ABC subunit UvrA, partial [Cyclobacteriaceae bacterium]|nr:excinuclease ABC subunit UvrA [Cyclobacteriaceae bacterium]
KKMIRQSEDQIIVHIIQNYLHKKIIILAPVVKGRKGHYRELFQQIRKTGFAKVRVDGEIMDLEPKMQVDRYKTHDIEVVIDRVKVIDSEKFRISQSIKNALSQGKGVIMLLDEAGQTHHFSKHLMDPESGLAYDDPAPNMFSFNSPYGACPTCNGLGKIEKITRESVIPDPTLSISRGGIAPLGPYREIWIFKKIQAILKRNKVDLSTPINKIPQEVIDLLLYGDKVPVAVSSVKYPGTDWHTKFEGIINFLEKQSEGGTEKIQSWVKEFMIVRVCPDCNGARLKKESLNFKIDGKNIADLATFDINNLGKWFENLEARLNERQKRIATEILKEIKKRIKFLLEVGLNYLHLNRPLKTLAGGEAQRIRLATQIGTQLVGVLYILDEPSIGLHQRDNIRLIKALQDLRDLGNSVLVVEHDKEMMLSSDYILDVGPGPGIHGGHIVAEGSPTDFLKQESLTADFLKNKLRIEVPEERRNPNGSWLELKGATGNNLKKVNLRLPLGTMICVTGVSGSGKS